MKQEQKLQQSLKNPDLLVIAGSRLYGTNTEESDYDYRGFVIPPFEYLTGLSKFEHHIIREPDIVIYSIKRFFELLIIGDPVIYEILFSPRTNIVKKTSIGDIIIHNRDIFLCQRFAKRISGYALSEWRKVTGTQLVPIKRTPDENNVINDIRDIFHPSKEEMDEIIRMLFSHHPREVKPARRKLGEKRKRQIEQFGYCVSSACHTIRLLDELVELHTTGKLTFPRPNRRELLLIKRGKISLDDIKNIYNETFNKAFLASLKSCLPKNPSIKKIRDLYHEIISWIIYCDPTIQQYRDNYIHKYKRWY